MAHAVDEATQVVMADMPDRAVIYADLTQVTLAGRVLAEEVTRLQEETILLALITKERNDYRLVIQEMQGHGGGDDPDLWACLVRQRNDLQAIIDRSGDVCPCTVCGAPVVCVGEGIQFCISCGEKEDAAQTTEQTNP